MKKTHLTRALFVAGAVALAGAAQADAIFYPNGTMVELGENGADHLAWNDDGTLRTAGMVDTSVLGGPAAMTSTTVTTVPTVEYVYVQPNIHFDRHAVRAQIDHPPVAMTSDTRVLGAGPAHDDKTFNVPARAGEASTMTNGAPNLVTSNDSFMVGSTAIPYSSITVGQPYYVLSY
ncbi:MAG: hypothetical protein EOO30_21580 [Comamonadaceae bacterium]|nr:MAG: hypothetical protein EOO30_21580 [Comamonadaceae bacterium]